MQKKSTHNFQMNKAWRSAETILFDGRKKSFFSPQSFYIAITFTSPAPKSTSSKKFFDTDKSASLQNE